MKTEENKEILEANEIIETDLFGFGYDKDNIVIAFARKDQVVGENPKILTQVKISVDDAEAFVGTVLKGILDYNEEFGENIFGLNYKKDKEDE